MVYDFPSMTILPAKTPDKMNRNRNDVYNFLIDKLDFLSDRTLNELIDIIFWCKSTPQLVAGVSINHMRKQTDDYVSFFD